MTDLEQKAAHLSSLQANIGFILSTHREIIKLILESLPIKELKNAEQVCVSWSQTGKAIRKKRTVLKCFIWKYNEAPHTWGLDWRSKPQERVVYPMMSEIMKEVLEQSPQLCLVFITIKTLKMFSPPDRSYHYIHEDLQKVLTDGCPTVLFFSEAIFGDDCSVGKKKMPIPAYEMGFTAVCFPEIPGVKMYTIQLQERTLRRKPIEWSPEEYRKKTKIPSNEVVKCLLVLSTRSGQQAKSLYQATCKRQDEPFAMGGCLIEYITIPQKDDINTYAVAFTGEGLRVASIVIPREIKKKASVERLILELKKSEVPAKNNLAIMLSCVARADSERTAQLFRKHFPNTLLSGLLGDGERGVTFLPPANGSDNSDDVPGLAPKKAKQDINFELSYSTVIILLMWGE